jgi:hypothetical protein
MWIIFRIELKNVHKKYAEKPFAKKACVACGEMLKLGYVSYELF